MTAGAMPATAASVRAGSLPPQVLGGRFEHRAAPLSYRAQISRPHSNVVDACCAETEK